MNIVIKNYLLLGGNSKRTEFDSTSSNHIVVDVNDNKLFIDFISFDTFYRNILNLDSTVELFLYFNETPTQKNIRNIKYIIRLMSINTKIENLNINIVSFNYESSYDYVHDILYSEPVDYSRRVVNEFILRSMVMKSCGLNGSRYIAKIISLLSQLKNKFLKR